MNQLDLRAARRGDYRRRPGYWLCDGAAGAAVRGGGVSLGCRRRQGGGRPVGAVGTRSGLDIAGRTDRRRFGRRLPRTRPSTAHGRIDILVNNAGITGGNGLTWELDPDVWRRVIDVNLVGCFLTCRSVIPHMIAGGYGRIVNIASIAGKEGNPNASHYSASKAGLIGLTKSLGKELAGRNILANCVTPAAANTDIFAQMQPEHIEYMRSRIPMGRFVEVDEIAALVCWLASEDCSFSTGAVFDISGGRATY